MSKSVEAGFPRWRYHKELLPEGKIVRSAVENKELGAGWVDSPAGFEVGESLPVVEPVIEQPKEEKAAAKPEPKKEESKDYSKMKIDALRELAESRGFGDLGGYKKADLIELLIEDDGQAGK